MDVRSLPLRDALLIEPKAFPDRRGCFYETFSVERYRAAGIAETFIQDSISRSMHNVVRGMHGDRRMSKMVQVFHGEILDVIADLREGSPTYGQWVSALLSDENHHQLYVPAGFVHGFVVLSESAVVAYKHSALYDPAHEFNVRWNDPTLAIEWPLDGEPILSERDRNAPLLSKAP